MRKILFRGKCIDNGEWAEGGAVVDSDSAHIVYQINEHIKRDDYECYAVEVDPATVSQFTGLIDKNGKGIFEGDILSDGAVVEWFDSLSWDGGGSNHSGFYCKKWFGYWRDGDLEYHNMFNSETEIIGNIFDNPELAAKR